MHESLLPKGWPRPKGYANGVAARGKLVFVAGQIGWRPDGTFASDDFVAQVQQALENVRAVLAAGGATPDDVTRMTWYVTDKQEYLANLAAVGLAYRRVMGKNFPAMTLVEVKALVEDRARVEIEATAVVTDTRPKPPRKRPRRKR